MTAGPPATRRAGRGRAAAGWLGGLCLLWLFGVWPPPVWWRDHWPQATAMMRLRGATAAPAPVPLDRIAPALQRMVVIGEDSRFWIHHGIDFIELGDALGLGEHRGLGPTLRALWRHRGRLRGASTIPQQLAKNLYLSPSRNVFRKIKEAVTAVRLDAALPKERILDLYLNTAELGDGVWGVEAASRAYFGVSASALTAEEASLLAATLPHPRTSNPARRPDRTRLRGELILARYEGRNVVVPPDTEADLDTLAVPTLVPIIPPALDSLHVKLPPP